MQHCVLEHSRSARKPCWNTVGVRTKKSAGGNRNAIAMQFKCAHNVLLLGYFPREAVPEYTRDAHREKSLEIIEMHARKCLNIVGMHARSAGIQ